MGFLDKLLGRKRTVRRDDSSSAGSRGSGQKTVVNPELPPLPPMPPAGQAPPGPAASPPGAWPVGGGAPAPAPQPGAAPPPVQPHQPVAQPPPARSVDNEKTMIGQATSSSSVIGVLVAVAGPDSGKVFALHAGKEEILLGRGSGSDVKLSCQSISRPHAKIIVDGEDMILLSMKDENLASIDGEKTEGSEIADGCLIGLGSDTLLRFRKIEGP